MISKRNIARRLREREQTVEREQKLLAAIALLPPPPLPGEPDHETLLAAWFESLSDEQRKLVNQVRTRFTMRVNESAAMEAVRATKE